VEIRAISADEARPLRHDVLKPTLPVSEVHFPGDDDPETFHLGAFDRGELVCVATFMPRPCPAEGRPGDWQLRGMATAERLRGAGIGGRLLEMGLERIASAGGRRVWCNGRTRAQRFYERHGFRTLGAEFESPNTGPHFMFVRELARVDATL
jgi:predicted GNAT family N-acyltransferase